jgi:hypothetical protein
MAELIVRECGSLPPVARALGIRAPAAAALILLGLLIAGCGAGQTFTASEFVDRISAQGVSIELGRRLPSGDNAKELYAVELPPLPGEPAPARGSEGNGGAGGTIYVFGDTGGADDQLSACRTSGGLLCFRVATIVVVLDDEGSGLEAQRLAVAMKRLAS